MSEGSAKEVPPFTIILVQDSRGSLSNGCGGPSAGHGAAGDRGKNPGSGDRVGLAGGVAGEQRPSADALVDRFNRYPAAGGAEGRAGDRPRIAQPGDKVFQNGRELSRGSRGRPESKAGMDDIVFRKKPAIPAAYAPMYFRTL